MSRREWVAIAIEEAAVARCNYTKAGAEYRMNVFSSPPSNFRSGRRGIIAFRGGQDFQLQGERETGNAGEHVSVSAVRDEATLRPIIAPDRIMAYWCPDRADCLQFCQESIAA
jgi:hypothetical protein